MLIDSNIIIYAMQSEHAALRAFIAEHAPAVSAISYVEVLGYHKLIEQERALLEAFFAAAPLLPLSQTVLDQAVKLRQLRKMTLGDALIAGTALAHQLTLVTRNTADFAWIAGLTLLNPFDLPEAPPKSE
ncbi:MAG TPA: type II toxin-antitoxin system VapC family toxin [Roseiflexaceae bacterium]